ncbi:hypothetical protein NPIL_383691 [Nephila pilipes]|uniref:Uncharacterized protein n=1 Tax=Nephila pilipes TaxID=299642 RepID=A0A8X6NY62_NEPPI|nr:hypothetical protein NPIL_383691 [Nephila pilipes]
MVLVNKSIATVFWETKGAILLDFLHQGTINRTRYYDTLTKLRHAIRRKRQGLLSEGVLFLDNNTKPLQQASPKIRLAASEGRDSNT